MNADSLKLQLYSSEEGVVADHGGQFTHGTLYNSCCYIGFHGLPQAVTCQL